jgi:hypothetical protein
MSMAAFVDTGMTWEQGIEQRPQDVQADRGRQLAMIGENESDGLLEAAS